MKEIENDEIILKQELQETSLERWLRGHVLSHEHVVCVCVVWRGAARHGRLGTVGYGMARHGWVRYGTVRYGTAYTCIYVLGFVDARHSAPASLI